MTWDMYNVKRYVALTHALIYKLISEGAPEEVTQTMLKFERVLIVNTLILSFWVQVMGVRGTV